MSVYEIPVTATPQTFLVTLTGTEYRLTLRYLDVDQGGWILNIADTEGTAILSGVPLVTGADLLAQYQHLGFGGSLIVLTAGDTDVVPTFAGLGSESRLYFVTSD